MSAILDAPHFALLRMLSVEQLLCIDPSSAQPRMPELCAIAQALGRAISCPGDVARTLIGSNGFHSPFSIHGAEIQRYPAWHACWDLAEAFLIHHDRPRDPVARAEYVADLTAAIDLALCEKGAVATVAGSTQ
jgi:hypothetical protein